MSDIILEHKCSLCKELAERNRPWDAAWDRKCAASICKLLELDRKDLTYLFENFHYCSPCREFIRDIDFTVRTLASLEEKSQELRVILSEKILPNLDLLCSSGRDDSENEFCSTQSSDSEDVADSQKPLTQIRISNVRTMAITKDFQHDSAAPVMSSSLVHSYEYKSCGQMESLGQATSSSSDHTTAETSAQIKLADDQFTAQQRSSQRNAKIQLPIPARKRAVRLYTCEVCPKVYTKRKSRDSHRIRHQRVPCSDCGKSFNKQTLAIHRKKETCKKDQKPYVCNCGKKYKREGDFLNHKENLCSE